MFHLHVTGYSLFTKEFYAGSKTILHVPESHGKNNIYTIFSSYRIRYSRGRMI